MPLHVSSTNRMSRRLPLQTSRSAPAAAKPGYQKLEAKRIRKTEYPVLSSPRRGLLSTKP